MGKYEEEIYGRAEHLFKDVESQMAWLSSFERPTRGENNYTKDAVKVRDELIQLPLFKQDISSSKEYDDLEKIKRDVKALPSYLGGHKQELLNAVELKQDKINRELTTLSEERKIQREEDEKVAKIESRRAEIKKELDRVRNLSDVADAKRRIENLSDETDTSDLQSQLEGMRISIEEQRTADTRAEKEANLESSDRRKRSNAVRWLRENPQ